VMPFVFPSLHYAMQRLLELDAGGPRGRRRAGVVPAGVLHVSARPWLYFVSSRVQGRRHEMLLLSTAEPPVSSIFCS